MKEVISKGLFGLSEDDSKQLLKDIHNYNNGILTPSSDFILNISKEYSIYICQERAIPQVMDGLKPVQRMALWLLKDRAEKIKTIALGGLLAYMKLYIHGDAPANLAIGFLAAPYKNNIPLIEGLGHFGSRIAPDAIGAARYTEVRRSKAAEALLYKDLDIVPLEDNYDGSTKKPKHFLPLIPLVLLNGISGIAVAWSTNILPRNLKDIIEATKNVLLDKPVKQLVPSYNKFNVDVINIGENQWEITGKLNVKGQTIQITELPPGMDIEKFRKKLIAMEDSEQIRSFVDKSTDRIDITIQMPRLKAAGIEIIDGVSYKHKAEKATITTEKDAIEFFKIKEKVTERIVVVDWNGTSMKQYPNAEDVVIDFVTWRLGWYKVRYQHLKTKDAYELTYWMILKLMFEKGFTKKLGTFANKTELQQNVIDLVKTTKLNYDDNHIDRVVNLQTYKWTVEFFEEIKQKIDELQKILIEYNEILASPEKIKEIYLKELIALKTNYD